MLELLLYESRRTFVAVLLHTNHLSQIPNFQIFSKYPAHRLEIGCFSRIHQPCRRPAIRSGLYTFPWATTTPSITRAGLRSNPYFSRISSESVHFFTTSASIPAFRTAFLEFSSNSLHF